MQGPFRKGEDYPEKDLATQLSESRDWSGTRNKEGKSDEKDRL